MVWVKTTREVKDVTTFLFAGRRFSLSSSPGPCEAVFPQEYAPCPCSSRKAPCAVVCGLKEFRLDFSSINIP